MIIHSKTGAISDDSEPKAPATGSVYEPTQKEIKRLKAILKSLAIEKKRASLFPHPDYSPVDRLVPDVQFEEDEE